MIVLNGTAIGQVARLRSVTPRGDFAIEAELEVPELAPELEVIALQSVWGRYRLWVDPIGSMACHAVRPRSWLSVPYFREFPARAWTFEWVLCPSRGPSRPTLLSYRSRGRRDEIDLAVYERPAAGLVVAEGEREHETGVTLDYNQWQHVALAWRGDTGEAALYKDDGEASIAAALFGEPVRYGPPRWEGRIAAGAAFADEGCLVIGQDPPRAGDLAAGELSHAFAGALLGVTLWDRALTSEQLDGRRGLLPSGGEPGLVSAWRFTQRGIDLGEPLAISSGPPSACLLGGTPIPRVRDARSGRLVFQVGGAAVSSVHPIPFGRPIRIRAVCRAGSAIRLDGGGYVECTPGLAVFSQDGLTLEVGVRPTRGLPVGIWGQPGRHPSDAIALSIDPDGRPVLSVTAGTGEFAEARGTQAYGPRCRRLTVVLRPRGDGLRVRFLIDREEAGDADLPVHPGAGVGPSRLGLCQLPGRPLGFRGTIADAITWPVALDPREAASLGADAPTFAWVARTMLDIASRGDAASNATVCGRAVVVPDPAGSMLSLEIDGHPAAVRPEPWPRPVDGEPACFRIGPADRLRIARIRVAGLSSVADGEEGQTIVEYSGRLHDGLWQDESASEFHLRIDGHAEVDDGGEADPVAIPMLVGGGVEE